MELTNEFRVPLPVADAWAVLTDVERIAPCMPGAQLQEIEGDEYRGVVKIKVGPITAQYKGKATFVERDETAHRAVLRAEGRDTRGQGNANATITATLVGDATGTTVTVVTDLTVTGRVAQFGRGVMADVSAKLLGQFVDCLESNVLQQGASAAREADPDPNPERDPAPEPAAAQRGSNGSQGATVATPRATAVKTEAPPSSASEPAAAVRKIDSADAEPIDLLGTAGTPMVKRAAPLAVLLFVLLVLRRRRRRRRARRLAL
jgi:carbon monoxide dehydrogenase subunit G